MTDPNRLIRDLGQCQCEGILAPLAGVMVIVLAAWAFCIEVFA